MYDVGGIDIQNARIRDLDSGYADYQVPALIDALEVRRIGDEFLPVSPVLYYLGRLAVLAFDTARPPASPDGRIEARPDRALEDIYLRNVRTIWRSIARVASGPCGAAMSWMARR